MVVESDESFLKKNEKDEDSNILVKNGDEYLSPIYKSPKFRDEYSSKNETLP